MRAIEILYPRPLRALNDHLARLVSGHLWMKVLVGMAAGILAGILIGPSLGLLPAETAITLGNWLAFPGQLFLTLVQMIVVPLVFASIIRGLAATENIEQLKKLGLSVVLFFVCTSAMSIMLGVYTAQLIKPGNYIDSSLLSRMEISVEDAVADDVSAPDFSTLPQLVINLFPSNPLNSMVEGQMLQVVIFAVIFGIALLMGVDRILDMCRTAVNVAGDLVACLVMDKWVGGPSSLEEERRQQAQLQYERLASNEDVVIVRE